MVETIVTFVSAWFAVAVVLGMIVGRFIQAGAGEPKPVTAIATVRPRPGQWEHTRRRAA